MNSKYFFLFFLLVLSLSSKAQDAVEINKEIQKIDSLIYSHQYNITQKKIDSLYTKLVKSNNSKKFKNQILELKYRKALNLDIHEQSSVEILKILLDMIDEVENQELHSLSCKVYLLIALTYEKWENGDKKMHLTKYYLQKAFEVYKKYNLNEVYSTYCIRKSSYHRYINEIDSVLHYATQAKVFASKYNNKRDLYDSYILLGFVANKNNDFVRELEYSTFLLEENKRINNRLLKSVNYNKIANTYLRNHNPQKALMYSDSAYFFYKELVISFKPNLSKNRYKIFENLGNVDSAFHYFKEYHENKMLQQDNHRMVALKELEEHYQNNKKEEIIESKNQQLLLVVAILILIALTSILIYKKNRKINSQNKIINAQIKQLNKTLDQKQTLLSELQHRVKNNLQHVISILEIQKESADFNNIEELIRGNQNRIHSMALLHTKLKVTDTVNEIDLKKYVSELAEIVKESYNNYNKQINLNITCEIENISLDKALPIGLIIVELISNSIKHAFNNKTIGIITIEITKQKSIKLYYADNGIGFDFNQTNDKGLGQEIIKGLIDQLNGTIHTNNKNGFELTIEF